MIEDISVLEAHGATDYAAIGLQSLAAGSREDQTGQVRRSNQTGAVLTPVLSRGEPDEWPGTALVIPHGLEFGGKPPFLPRPRRRLQTPVTRDTLLTWLQIPTSSFRLKGLGKN